MKSAILSAFIAAIAALSVSAQPGLRWLETVHDFGAFHEDVGLVKCSFKAVNETGQPVSVLKARANCGCTRPTYNKEPIAPGDTLTVSVAYDASGRPGAFSKQVRVETTAGKHDFLIKGTVIGSPNTLATRYPVAVGEMRVSNSMTPFGQALKGRVLSAAVNIYNPTDHDIRPAVDSLPPYVNALFRPEVIKTGEQGTLSLTAYTDRCDDYGVVTDRFILIPDSENSPESRVAIATTIIVNEDFSKLTPEEKERGPVASLSNDILDFGRLSATDGKKTMTLTITNTGKSQLIVRRYFTADPAVSLHIDREKIKPGKSAKLRVTVDCSRLHAPDPLNARITLITNSPSAPSQIVRVVAEVK